MTPSKGNIPEEKAWAKYVRSRYENMSRPETLVMLAIRDAFRFAFQEAAQQKLQATEKTSAPE